MDFKEFKNDDNTIGVLVDGKPLTCPVCTNQAFYERKALLNTRRSEFFNLAWADKNAENYICGNCGYIFWFLR